MEQGHYLEPDTILLLLSQEYEVVGPFENPQAQLPIGWLRPAKGSYCYTPAPRPENESLEMTLLREACDTLFREPGQNLTTQDGVLGTVKKVAIRINEWGVRVIYWNYVIDREMARLVIAIPGSLDAKLTWGPVA